jgi:hypothetical protein
MNRTGKPLVFVVIAMLIAPLFLQAQLNSFVGNWQNVDHNTRGVTRLVIHKSPLKVHAWGKCHPQDCDWGEVDGYAYAPNVSASVETSAEAVTAVFTTGFSNTLMVLRADGANRLKAEVYTRFTDNSNRSNYTDTYIFQRQLIILPPPVMVVPTPTLVSPANGSVFKHYPRATNLVWQPVAGASQYIVEVEYGDPSGQTFTAYINQTVSATNYAFNFVGAQPGRWRVCAIGSGGAKSAFSQWWEFRYTR